ncbi:MAG TPA: AAA family ATPase, partial [Thermoanaerobaculia bacterium]|nr:AAA family ATPase [Thermoanaerobaculia bacterium]
GQAAQEAREHLRATRPPGDPSVLAYTVYGNPNARVLFGEDADVRNAPPAIREKIHEFGPLIRRKTEGFVGRQWLFDAIDRFVTAETRGYVQILGDPGIGKTTLLAEMVKRWKHPHHFNVRSEGIQKPEQFLPNLCAQLVARFRLGPSSLPPEVSRDAAVLSNFLEKAAAKLRPSGRKLLVLVDALDESDPGAVTRGSNTLYLPAELPDGVFFVVTSRRGGPPLIYRCADHKIDLQKETENNFADVRLFAEKWIGKEGIQTYIHNQGLENEAFVDEIVRLSEGNFMYLYYVLPEIEKGTYRDLKFTELPAGLESYYEDHWQRMRVLDRPAWEGYKLPVLVALAIAKEPISMDLIADFSGVEKRTQIRAALDEWAAFLHSAEVEEDGTKETRWRLYHDSFHDFIEAKDLVQDELVDLKAAHGKAADALWNALYPET